MNGWQQLLALRALSATTLALHEAQLLQLKTWPLVVFPHLKKHTFSWEMKDRRVFYKFVIDSKKRVPRNLKARFEALDQNIKAMLGEEWSIEVKAAGRNLYQSYGRQPEPKQPEPQQRPDVVGETRGTPKQP